MQTSQKIFGLLRPSGGVSRTEILALMQAEAACLWSLYEQGVVREAWARTDALGAVYVLEATPAQARRLLDRQPLCRRGLVSFEVIPVGPFTSLSMLFGTQPRPILAASAARSGRSQRILALEVPCRGVGEDDLVPHAGEDARHAWSLCKGGAIREVYLRTDRPGALIVLEADGVVGARRILGELPLARRGLVEFDCLALAAFKDFDALLEGALDD